MRKQIGLRMKDETRDQLERVRGGLSRTDYIEGAVLAQIARDLKKVETPHEYSLESGFPIITDDRMPKDMIMPIPQTVQEGELRDGSRIEDGDVYPEPLKEEPTLADTHNMMVARGFNIGPVRSYAESKAGVLPVPKKAQKGRK